MSVVLTAFLDGYGPAASSWQTLLEELHQPSKSNGQSQGAYERH